MMTYRVETCYFTLDGDHVAGPFWYDRGVAFSSPYGAAMYAKGLDGFSRVYDEDTEAEPAHGGAVDAETWEMKEEWRDRGMDRLVFEHQLKDRKLPYGCV